MICVGKPLHSRIEQWNLCFIFNEDIIGQVANIVHGATAAISYLHAKSPAVTHRDMKVRRRELGET